MERKRAKVTMLPTEDVTMVRYNLYKFTEQHGNPLEYGKISNAEARGYKYQHLYFTTDEEIKVGDWTIDVECKLTHGRLTKIDNEIELERYASKPEIKKVVATTDPKIKMDVSFYSTFSYHQRERLFPQPSKDFVRAFCKQGGIHEVDLEYKKQYDDAPMGSDEPIIYMGSELKVDENHNTITTHRIKDSWNWEEMCDCMQYYMEYCNKNGYITPMEWYNDKKHF